MENKIENNNQIEEDIKEKEFFSLDKKIPSTVTLLKQAWNIYRENFLRLILVILIPTIVTFLITAVGALLMADSVSNISEEAELTSLPWGSLSLAFAAIVIPIIIIQSVGYLALIFAVKDRDKKLSLSHIYSIAFSKIVPYWWTSLMVAIVVFFGFIALIIPGLLFLVWFGFAPLISAVEDKRGWEALKTSKHYVSGRALKIAFRLIVVLIIALVVSLISETIAGRLGSQIASLATAPFFMAYYFLLYKGIKKA